MGGGLLLEQTNLYQMPSSSYLFDLARFVKVDEEVRGQDLLVAVRRRVDLDRSGGDRAAGLGGERREDRGQDLPLGARALVGIEPRVDGEARQDVLQARLRP